MRSAFVPEELRHVPFTADTAARYGVSRRALRGSEWRNIFRGVWAHRDLPDDRETRLAAVCLILPVGAFVCGLTAAWLRGADAQDHRFDHVWVGCRTGHRLRTRAGCLVREITVDDTDLEDIDGAWVTTPVRTVFDCSRWLGLVEAVVVADALAHAGLTDATNLEAYYRRHRGLRGVRQVAQVIDLMDPLAESPMETRVRVLVTRAGLPAPISQYEVCSSEGGFVARADFAYPAARLIVEYDGAWHWEQRRADDRRRDAMRALGWHVLVVSREDYYETPERTVDIIRTHLASRTKCDGSPL